jgi:hypothetical protein
VRFEFQDDRCFWTGNSVRVMGRSATATSDVVARKKKGCAAQDSENNLDWLSQFSFDLDADVHMHDAGVLSYLLGCLWRRSA